MNSQIQILHAKPYDVFDKDTKTSNKGVSIRFQVIGHQPAIHKDTGEVLEAGSPILKGSLPLEVWGFIQKHGLQKPYPANFSMNPTEKGIMLKVTNLGEPK